MTDTSQLCDIGFIGLGVMGKNLALNLADNGYKIAAFDLDSSKIEQTLIQDDAERGDKPRRIVACNSFTELLSQLKTPHLIMLSVPAGKPVDSVCLKLIDAGISPDDIVIDTGNSLWTDTRTRIRGYRGKFIFFATAVSGGEEGARFGPSLMPSGDEYAWPRVRPVLEAIAAKVDPDTGKPIELKIPGQPVKHGEPCAAYIGKGSSGHFVKMVHNGIEYADMQLICEVYHQMRMNLGMTPKAIAEVFRAWNKGPLESYLIEISAEVLDFDDPESGKPLVDIILDQAGQKGTGLWTAMSSLELGAPAPTIANSVYARALSTLKKDRTKASELLAGPTHEIAKDDLEESIKQLHDALYCAKICAYAQGFQLMQSAAKEYGWTLNFANIAKIWRAGCIIRAVFLSKIMTAYQNDPELSNLLLDPFFSEQINKYQQNWRQVVANAALTGIPTGAISSALAYYDSYRTKILPANLLQGQRDFFGAHTFARNDGKEGKFHVQWHLPERNIVKVD
jgi:6-phosphogluconate dehydrogenase